MIRTPPRGSIGIPASAPAITPAPSGLPDDLKELPSGTGVKLIARGRLDPNGRRKNGPVEVYDRSRFFAVTGRRVPGTPARVAQCQDALAALQRRLAPPTREPPPGPAAGGGLDGPD